MPKDDSAASTPHYVLLDGNQRIGPNVLPLRPEVSCSVIFGFSDKGPYDLFCKNCDLALTPYPLVKGYLSNQIESSGHTLNLVVLDAEQPREPGLHAATMEAVLQAHQSETTRLNVSHWLSLDPETDAYQVRESRSQ